MTKKKLKIKTVNPHCAGIDVGSKSHFVAIGQDAELVKEFGVYASDLRELSQWLLDNNINSVAMESTGSYWQNLFIELINAGFKVILTSGRYTKNVNRKKTDVLDCQWIQKLHSLGILPSCFLPDSGTEKLRTLVRHRLNIIKLKADTSHKMQKFLKLLNFRLDVVVRDITGVTGIKIIEDICSGNLNPKSLAKHRHYTCRKSEEEIAKALVSNEREDYLFGLKQEFERYTFYKKLISKCDYEIKTFIEQSLKQRPSIDTIPEKKPYKRNNKNTIQNLDLNLVAYKYFGGVDLFKIPGVSFSTVLTIMSEIGLQGFYKFETAKQFASWLRLAPNNRISGGKYLSRKIPKGSGRLKIALRNAANAIGNLKDSDLGKFFRKISHRKGRQSAITATARKLAVIIWNMVTKKQEYKPRTEYVFLDEKRRQLALIRKRIKQYGINPNDIGIFTRPEYKLKHLKKLE